MGANDSLDSSDDEANMERPSTTRKSTAERKRAMYLRMFELMGLGDHRVVVNMLVTKVCNNMKFWADDKEVIGRSLDVFFWLSAGYGSGRFMLTLDAVKYLLTPHRRIPAISRPAREHATQDLVLQNASPVGLSRGLPQFTDAIYGAHIECASPVAQHVQLPPRKRETCHHKRLPRHARCTAIVYKQAHIFAAL